MTQSLSWTTAGRTGAYEMAMETVELHRRFHVWDRDFAAEPVYWWPGYADHVLT